MHRTTPYSYFSHSHQENVKWADLKTATPALNTPGWYISCSKKAQMNTNPEGLSIKLHILIAAFLMRNVMSLYFLCISSIIFHKRQRESMHPPSTFTKTLFIDLIKEGRNLQSLQLISELWLSLSTNLAGQSFLTASATRHYWLLCPRESNLQIEKLLELILETLNNFAVFIMAAYSRVLQGATNQLGTVEVCLLSANSELFLVQ